MPFANNPANVFSIRMKLGNHLLWGKVALFVIFSSLSIACIITVKALCGPAEPTKSYIEDYGLVLSATQMLLRGQMLYENVFWPYGPIPILSYEKFASIMGNSPDSFLSFDFICSVPITFLIYTLVRRRLPFLYSFLFLLMLFQVQMPLSRTLLYSKFELLFLLLAALAWKPLETRTSLHCLSYGVLMACLQFTKFGPHVAFAGTLFLLDMLQVVQRRFSAESLRQAIRKNLLMLVSYGVFLGAGILIMMLYLGRPAMVDVLWPAFMENVYANFFSDDIRYPSYLGFNYFIGGQLCPLAGLITCFLAILYILRRAIGPTDHEEKLPDLPFELMLCPLFYLVAIPLFFRQAYHYTQYGTLAILGIPLLYELLERKNRALLLPTFLFYACLIPFFGFKGYRAALHYPPMVRLMMPNGVTLVGTADDVGFYRSFIEEVRSKAHPLIPGEPFPTGLIEMPGMYYFTGLNAPGRYIWLMVGLVRPWEEEALTRDMRRISVAALSFKQGGVPSTRDLEQVLQPLPEPARRDLISRLSDPVYLGPDPYYHRPTWIYSVRKE